MWNKSALKRFFIVQNSQLDVSIFDKRCVLFLLTDDEVHQSHSVENRISRLIFSDKFCGRRESDNKALSVNVL